MGLIRTGMCALLLTVVLSFVIPHTALASPGPYKVLTVSVVKDNALPMDSARLFSFHVTAAVKTVVPPVADMPIPMCGTPGKPDCPPDCSDNCPWWNLWCIATCQNNPNP